MVLGQNIIKARIKRKLSREKLARLCDISLSQMYRIEKGLTSPTADKLIAISKALNTSLDVLTGLKPIGKK